MVAHLCLYTPPLLRLRRSCLLFSSSSRTTTARFRISPSSGTVHTLARTTSTVVPRLMFHHNPCPLPFDTVCSLNMLVPLINHKLLEETADSLLQSALTDDEQLRDICFLGAVVGRFETAVLSTFGQVMRTHRIGFTHPQNCKRRRSPCLPTHSRPQNRRVPGHPVLVRRPSRLEQTHPRPPAKRTK